MSKGKAILVLENGSVYEGISCGAAGEKVGWVSFYTGVVGYQEVITSPSNAGKIILMTYPLIGNYGVAKKFRESKQSWLVGLIIKEKSRITSNWQAEEDLTAALKDEKALAMEAVDTRALMVELRQAGEQWGIISTRDFKPQSLKKKIEQTQQRQGLDLIKNFSSKRITRLSKKGPAVAIIDIGVTNSLTTQLTRFGAQLNLIPYDAPAEKILALSPKGIIISDGPETDRGIDIVVDTVKRLLGRLPIFGLGAGCQVLVRAMGAGIKKMHLGHHGVNYPILQPGSLKGEITVQNHSYVIDEDSLDGNDVEVTWRNINDQTIEGIRNSKLKASGCQFYPASLGFDEVNPILGEFISGLSSK